MWNRQSSTEVSQVSAGWGHDGHCTTVSSYTDFVLETCRTGRWLHLYQPYPPLLNSKLYSSGPKERKGCAGSSNHVDWASGYSVLPAIWDIYLGSKAQFVRKLLG
ncbi:hypothetical protein PAHAL_2G281200 [Panicum hallii]|uniref:Uncharacterized protein n=1 Tax=Panicum hallii TaxID=206008 RepID=A0A2T8KQL1_9POAL|nr:hypothetical protein PAHAL_2G281200 [Panicum hallii]